MDGTDSREEVVEADTTEFLFNGLSKGTFYMARVAGNNSRGFGAFSEFEIEETNIDRE